MAAHDEPGKKVVTWQLRERFAAGLSAMYASEVPAYTTLVDVSAQVDRDYVTHHPGAGRLGALERITAKRHDAAMATPDPAAVWGEYFPSTDYEIAAQGLAYYRRGDPSKPVVYEDFLPASAAGIFRSNLDRDTAAGEGGDDSGYSMGWLAGAIGRRIDDPYALYEALSQEAPA